jgi:hypothetical protein
MTRFWIALAALTLIACSGTRPALLKERESADLCFLRYDSEAVPRPGIDSLLADIKRDNPKIRDFTCEGPEADRLNFEIRAAVVAEKGDSKTALFMRGLFLVDSLLLWALTSSPWWLLLNLAAFEPTNAIQYRLYFEEGKRGDWQSVSKANWFKDPEASRDILLNLMQAEIEKALR